MMEFIASDANAIKGLPRGKGYSAVCRQELDSLGLSTGFRRWGFGWGEETAGGTARSTGGTGAPRHPQPEEAGAERGRRSP